MSRRKAAIATFAGSSLSTLIAAAQAILLLPICINAVGDKLYGSWLAIGDLLLCLCAFDFGLPNLMIQRAGAAHAKGDEQAVGRYFATGVFFLLGVALLLGGGLWIASPVLARVFTQGHSGDAPALSTALQLGVVATMLTIVNYAFQGLSRAIQRTSFLNAVTVVGALAGFALTFYLLNIGRGLDAIAIGLIVRSAINITGGLLFLLFMQDTAKVRRSLRWSKEVWSDYLKNSPVLFASGLSYALMTNSQMAIAVFFLKPELVVVYSVTRRAAEFGKSFLDMIGYASIGGIAHLTASGDQEKIRSVYRELNATYFAAAIAIVSAYIAGNASFVHVWMGDAYYGGLLLTVIIATRVVFTGWSYFEWSLLRASGEIKLASVAMMVECVSRLALMVILVSWLGVYGLPLSGVLTGLFSGLWARRKQFAHLDQSLRHRILSSAARLAPFAASVGIALLIPAQGWRDLLIAAAIAMLISVAMSLFLESGLSTHFHALKHRLTRRIA